MKTIQITKSVESELEKLPKWRLMLYLQEKGESEVYHISKDLGWTTGKTHALVNSLLRSKAVKIRSLVRNGRALKLAKLAE